MSFLQAYIIVAIGVAVSILLPILRRLLPAPPTAGGREGIKTILIVGAFSLLTALLVVAMLGDNLADWQKALLAGYAWDSTLQKVAGPTT